MHFFVPPFSIREQIPSSERAESTFDFSAAVSFRLAIDLRFSSTDSLLFSVESLYRCCCQRAAEEKASYDTSERLMPEAKMRCNACWRELEGPAVSTACGHLFCTEDASKILNNDAACPICDQVLSKSLIKPVDINPNEEWTNMAMAGVSPQILMKSAYRSVMFFLGQKELQMQFKMNKLVAQCRQRCEAMQEKFSEKLEQVQTAYQNLARKCQMMEEENERLSKDNQVLQEKLAEKSRQKRKLDDMYDHLKSEYESAKRSAIQPANNLCSRKEPDFFANTTNMNMMGSGDTMRRDASVSHPRTPGPREDIWPAPARQTSSNNSGHFSFPGGSPMKQPAMPIDNSSRRVGGDCAFGGNNSRRVGGGNPTFGGGASNGPSMSLRNLILSPIKRPQLTRNRNQMFSL